MSGRRHRHSSNAARACSLLGCLVLAGTAGGATQARPGQQPPTNLSLPTIGGSATVGQTVTGNPGAWEGRGLRFAYQWLRCGSSGAGCSQIAGATALAYVVQAGDTGATLRFRVDVSNRYGAASSTSAATSLVAAGAALPPTAPSNTSPPTVSGTPQVGQTLSAPVGSWVGTNPIAYTYQWRRCDATGGACAAIAGATGASYSVVTGDVGSRLRVTVTASNAVGESSAESAPTSSVSPLQSPPPTTQPSFPIHATFYYPWYPETWTVNGAHVFYHPTLGYSSTTTSRPRPRTSARWSTPG